MNKFAMIVLLPSKKVDGFKKKLKDLDKNIKIYDVLVNGIKCCEEALAIKIDGDAFKWLRIFESCEKEATLKMILPLETKNKKAENEKICTFVVQFAEGEAVNNFLYVWYKCTNTKEESSSKLDYAIYVEEGSNIVTFQAFCLRGVNVDKWCESIRLFCIETFEKMEDNSNMTIVNNVTIEDCLIKINSR